MLAGSHVKIGMKGREEKGEQRRTAEYTGSGNQLSIERGEDKRKRS